jgi:hypothetical protein
MGIPGGGWGDDSDEEYGLDSNGGSKFIQVK